MHTSLGGENGNRKHTGNKRAAEAAPEEASKLAAGQGKVDSLANAERGKRVKVKKYVLTGGPGSGKFFF